jgi:hypothetical protein
LTHPAGHFGGVDLAMWSAGWWRHGIAVSAAAQILVQQRSSIPVSDFFSGMVQRG